MKPVFIYRPMVICVDSQKVSTKKKARIISEFSKVIGYKVKAQKSLIFYMLAMNNCKLKCILHKNMK